MNRRLVIRYQVEPEIVRSPMKAFSKLILFGTLATIAVLGSFTPSLGFADVFGQSHARCRNEAPLLQFSIPSTDSEAFGNRASSRSCFDYSISLSQTSASLAQGTNISLAVSVSLSRGVAGPVDLLWNTAGYPASTYELSALAPPVQGETSLEDNFFGHAMVKLTEESTGPSPSSSLTGLSLATETVILVSLGEALLGLFIIGRRISGKPRKTVTKTKR